MLESLLVVARQVGVLFALMGVGVLCNRCRILSEKAVKGLVELLMLVVTPCVIMQAFQRPFDRHLLQGLEWALGIALFTHALGILAAMGFRTRDMRRRSVLRFATTFSNAGFMGIPLEYALLGNDGVFFGAVYVAVFNVVCWSWGLVTMCGSMKEVRIRTLLVNPGTVGIALGLPFFFFSFSLPAVLADPVRMLADLNTPVAMLVIGYYLSETSFGEVLRCGAAYVAVFLRLVALPCAVLGTVWLCRPADGTMAIALVTAASAPVAALTTAFAAKYNRDVSLSVGLVSGSTLFSLVTMPPIVGLAMWLFR
ncbi:MAG: AEC family transporter [Kiritimatiellae bacterium]|nr:AEC family transporter [Kiritimatiellia bacterium]